VAVPKDCVLAICPFVSHLDPALYGPRAGRFDPERSPLVLGQGDGSAVAVAPSVAGGWVDEGAVGMLAAAAADNAREVDGLTVANAPSQAGGLGVWV
jgi:hypothetical protein